MSSFATPFARLYPAFAGGFLLSYFFRSVNAVISPDLTRELALEPASLGLLTSAYFMAFSLPWGGRYTPTTNGRPVWGHVPGMLKRCVCYVRS